MLPPFYTKEEDIPENLKAHYALRRSGQWVLELDKDHPVLKKNAELLGINSTLKTDYQKLLAERNSLAGKSLAEGKVAVDPAVAELGEMAQSLGLKKRDIPELKHKAESAEAKLKEETESRLIAKAAAAAGKNPDAFAEHAKAKNLSFKETVAKDAKGGETVSLLVVTKGENGQEIETPLREYAERNAAHVACAGKQKTRFGFPKEKGAPETGNKFEQIREKVRSENGIGHNGNQSFAEKFHGANSAAITK